jgi:hypothetical protein
MPLAKAASGSSNSVFIWAAMAACAKAHAAIAAQMKTELEEPLAAFASGIKERRKIILRLGATLSRVIPATCDIELGVSVRIHLQ